MKIVSDWYDHQLNSALNSIYSYENSVIEGNKRTTKLIWAD